MESKNTGTCPVCNGTGRVPTDRPHPCVYGFDKATMTVLCTNCGGQTMSLKPTGKVRLRPDGTPCRHKYTERNIGRCYSEYVCKECGDRFCIDSGD